MEIGLLLVFAAGLVLQWIRAIGHGRQARLRPLWPEPPRPQAWPSVSIIVPAWQEQGTIEVCLAALADVDYPAFEVVVLAGGPDGTFEAAQRFTAGDSRVRVFAQRPAGKNGALNDGVRLTAGEIVVFLDADSRVARDWLKQLVAALEGGIAASTGNHIPLLDTAVTRREQKHNVLEYEIRGRVMLQGSGSFAVRRQVLDLVGEFPEGVYADDWDLTWRLEQHGLRCAFARNARVRSERPATLSEWFENEVRWRRIHLRSLWRVRGELIAAPITAGRHLYPYLLAWVGFALAAAAGVAVVASDVATIRGIVVEVCLLFWAWCLAGELATIAEVITFTHTREWLRVAPLAPAFVVLELAASALATLTSGQASIRYKGPRRGSLPLVDTEAAEPQLAKARYR